MSTVNQGKNDDSLYWHLLLSDSRRSCRSRSQSLSNLNNIIAFDCRTKRTRNRVYDTRIFWNVYVRIIRMCCLAYAYGSKSLRNGKMACNISSKIRQKSQITVKISFLTTKSSMKASIPWLYTLSSHVIWPVFVATKRTYRPIAATNGPPPGNSGHTVTDRQTNSLTYRTVQQSGRIL